MKDDCDTYERLRKAFDDSYSQGYDQSRMAQEDRRFYSTPGAQWEGRLGEQFENRPKIEVNKVHQAVVRIFSEYRNNRISVDFRSAGDDFGLSETLDGLYRADEQMSSAQEAYDTAFDEMVGGGYGAWRLIDEYEDEEDEDSDRLRVRIESIPDADNRVYWDVQARRQDKSDAKFCFVLVPMSRDAYQDEYEDDPSSWPKSENVDGFDWWQADTVWVAECYEIEMVKREYYWYRDLEGNVEKIESADLDEDRRLELESTGSVLIKKRRANKRQVHKYVLGGCSILRDDGPISGKHIPVVPVYGKRWFINGVEHYMGAVRLEKDAQRLYNIQLSSLAELAALSEREVPILFPEQIAGHALSWAQGHITRHPYRLINLMKGPDGNPVPSGPLGYTKPPSIPPALVALLQSTDQAIQELSGNQQNAEKLISNVSAKAVELVQTRLDAMSFIYFDNFSKGIKRCGEIWLSKAKEIYIEAGRKMAAVDVNGKASSVELLKPDAKDGVQYLKADLSKADHQVIADVGPSFTTRRDATVRAITGLIQSIGQADPQAVPVLGAFAMMHMEIEGGQDFQDWNRRRLVQMGVVKPNAEEKAEMEQMRQQGQQPDPQAVYLQAEAQKSQAMAGKAQAETQLTLAKIPQAQAQTAKLAAEAESEELDQAHRSFGVLKDHAMS